MYIIAACGNGMGTSMLIRTKIAGILRKHDIKDVKLEVMSAGQAQSQVNVADIIVCSKHLVDQFATTSKAKIVGIMNAVDEKEIEAGLLPYLK